MYMSDTLVPETKTLLELRYTLYATKLTQQFLTAIGSYGTRNVIEVMESWFWERPTDCLVLCLF